MKYQLSILTIALSSFPAIAGATNPLEVNVTGTRSYSGFTTAQTIQILTADELNAAGISSLNEALDLLNGVTIARNGSVGSSTSMFVRGSNSNHLIVLIDGQRATSTTDGKTEVEYIPLELVERIEFVPGGLSTLYGADAIGGVLQIFTKPLASRAVKQISTRVGEGHYDLGYLSLGKFSESGNYRINLGQTNSSGYDASNVYADTDDDGFSKRHLDLALSHRVGKLNLSGFLSAWEGTTEFDEDTFSSSNATDFYTRRVGAKLEFFSSRIGFDSQFSDLKNDRRNYDQSDRSSFNSTHVDRTEWTNTANIELDKELFLTAGFDLRNESAQSTYATGKTETQGVFASLKKSFKSAQLEGSIRRERQSTYGYQTSWSSGVTVPITDRDELYLSRKFAYANPTLADLDATYGNANLVPEGAYTTEAGYRFNQLNGWSGTLSTYETEFTNLIEFQSWVLSNIGQARTRGVELSLYRQFNSLAFNIDLAYLDSENMDQNGAPLINRAAHQAKLSTRYRLSEATSINLGYQYTGNLTSLDADTYAAKPMPDYALWSLGASHNYNENLFIGLHIDNLLDKTYEPVDGFNGRGRYAEASIRYTFH